MTRFQKFESFKGRAYDLGYAIEIVLVIVKRDLFVKGFVKSLECFKVRCIMKVYILLCCENKLFYGINY